MKAPDRARDYLDHILEAAEAIAGYIADMDFAAFELDRRTQDAVMRNLEIVGEAAIQLSASHPTFVAAHPEIPWQDMRGMRNRLAHGYFTVNLSVVWQTVQSHLPELGSQIAALMAQED
jgi:uncharacterized protein with HEPN domain